MLDSHIEGCVGCQIEVCHIEDSLQVGGVFDVTLKAP